MDALTSGTTRVQLDRARTPAPSWAASGWLETSIRSYAKYVDIVAKSLKDEQERVRRETMAIKEVRLLLAEMLKDSHNSQSTHCCERWGTWGFGLFQGFRLQYSGRGRARR